MTEWEAIAARISEVTHQPFRPRKRRDVGGGCINTAVALRDGERGYFIKLNRADRLDMFEAEADGLAAMADTDTVRVPRPICTGTSGGQSWLVMELLELGGRANGAEAGRRLAAMHRASANTFGWHRDNTIGSTPQHNRQTTDWVVFWRDQRLGYQLELATHNGYGRELRSDGDRLLADFGALLDHSPSPSLLHGDLWGGNVSYTRDGMPVLFDPAVYYGDREADLAMTELFGGFGGDFLPAYRETWPLDPGYATRKTLYNLYHILNHLNLFGSGYLGQSQAMISRLLAAIH